MANDGDRLLNIIGVVLVLAIIAALIILVMAAMSAPSADDPAEGPAANWRMDRINETHVRVMHAGGEPVDTAHLVITVDGTPRHPQWSGTILTEGEGATVRVREGQPVRLYWTGTPGKRDVLARWPEQ